MSIPQSLCCQMYASSYLNVENIESASVILIIMAAITVCCAEMSSTAKYILLLEKETGTFSRPVSARWWLYTCQSVICTGRMCEFSAYRSSHVHTLNVYGWPWILTCQHTKGYKTCTHIQIIHIAVASSIFEAGRRWLLWKKRRNHFDGRIMALEPPLTFLSLMTET